jgi:four helix bundle protein
MSGITRFEDLVAWQKARWLSRDIYWVTSVNPFARDHRFCDQIHSAALSVPSNIAEGFERNSPAQFRHFLSVAKASCAEVRSQLYCAHDVGYVDEETLAARLSQAEEVGRVIAGLRSSVK